MLRSTPSHLARRLALKNRAQTHDCSLARTKYATGNHYVFPSPNVEDQQAFATESYTQGNYSLADRYLQEKEGHRENPIKDWLIPKPTRWQTEWAEYMKKKNLVEQAAIQNPQKVANPNYNSQDKSSEKYVERQKFYNEDVTQRVNFDYEMELKCFVSRMKLESLEFNQTDMDQICMRDGYFSQESVESGRNFVDKYLKLIFQKALPKLPENLVENRLIPTILAENYLEYQLKHTGISDFYPSLDLNEYQNSTASFNQEVFFNLINFINSQSTKLAVQTTQTIVLSNILQRDLLRDLLQISPNEAKNLLQTAVNDKIEARLIQKSSSSEVIRVYHVGLYQQRSKKFVSSSFGETLQAAEGDAYLVGLSKVLDLEGGMKRVSKLLL